MKFVISLLQNFIIILYGSVDCVRDGIYRYYTQEEFNTMIQHAKEVVVIQNPTEDELEEFMTDFYKYD